MAGTSPARVGVTPGRIASAAWALVVAVALVAVVLAVLGHEVRREGDPGGPGLAVFAAGLAVIGVAFASVGRLVALHQGGNAIGWLLVGIGAAVTVGLAADLYAGYGYFARPLPARRGVAWLAAFLISAPGLAFGPFGFFFLLFPDGRFHDARWRRLGVLLGAVTAALVVIAAVRPGDLPAFPVENPLGIDALRWVSDVEVVLTFLLLALLLGSAGSLVSRYRVATGVVRSQIKYLALAGIVIGLALVSGPLWWEVAPQEVAEVAWPVLFSIAAASIPVASGMAILRHRLYDIDRVVSRTVGYALLTASVAGLYAAGVFGLGTLVRIVGGGAGGSVVIAVMTLAVAAVFGPLRRRVQGAVDRRFNRARYDARRAVESFASKVRGGADVGELVTEVVGVAAATVQPASGTVWLRT